MTSFYVSAFRYLIPVNTTLASFLSDNKLSYALIKK